MNIYDHVVAVIICILAPVLAFTSRQISTEDIRLESEDKIRLYHSNGLLLLVFSLVIITMWRIPDRPISGLGLDLAVWHRYVPALLMAIFLFYFIDIFLQYGNRRWREKTMLRKQKSLTFIPTGGKELFHFIFLALAAGIGEEIIFRGFLINYLLSWTGNTTEGLTMACVVSSALFAFLHGYQGMGAMAKIFFLSLLFSAVFVLTESLIIVIIVHAMIDIFTGLVGVYVAKKISHDPPQ